MALTRMMWVAADTSRTHVGGIQKHAVRLSFLLALLCCTAIARATEHDLRIDAAIGSVTAVEGDGSALWIGTSEGLYRWGNTQQGTPEKVADTDWVYVLLRDENTLWIGSRRGLFRWDIPGQGAPQLIEATTGPVNKLHKVNQTLLIGASNGLFVWQSVAVDTPTRTELDISHVTFYQATGTQLWIGAQQGLFRYTVGEREPTLIPQGKDVSVTSLYDGGSELLIGTNRGLLRWDKNDEHQPGWVLPGVEVASLYPDGSALLISTRGSGLLRFNDLRTGQPESIDRQMDVIHSYFKNGPIFWMGAGMGAVHGLYQWNTQTGGTPKRMIAVDTGFIYKFHQSGDTLWIGAQKGLFRINGLVTEWRDAGLKITSDLPKATHPDNNLLVRWEVGNFGWRTSPNQVQYRVIVTSGGHAIQPGEWEVTGGQEFTLPKLPVGTYSLYIQATDLNGKTAVSPPQYFSVTVPEETGWGIWIQGGLIALLVLALFILPPKLMSILLQADVWGINTIASVVYLARPGRWKLYRKYRKQLLKDRNITDNVGRYVDLPYEADGQAGDAVNLSDRFAQLPPSTRVVVIADGGHGKSTLCQKLTERCILKRDLFGGRLLEPVLIDGVTYAGNLLKTITSVLTKGGAYVNETIVSSQLKAGHLLIIFDGFSEIPEDYLKAAASEDLPYFVGRYPDTPLIFTSRSSLPASTQQALGDVLTVRLADLDETNVRPFLGQYLKRGTKDVDALMKEIQIRFPDLPRIPLMLKLIATVYDKKARIPKDRATLFAEYVDYVLRPKVTGIEQPIGLHYAIGYLVRETYLQSGGDRGFTFHHGVVLLGTIKETLSYYDITHSPAKLLRLLTRAGLYKQVGGHLKFFHDSFESYFAARTLESDFRDEEYELIKQCVGNNRLSETWRFLGEILEESGDMQKLHQVI
jgi:hypothetical protein